jgi:hypothetical protein
MPPEIGIRSHRCRRLETGLIAFHAGDRADQRIPLSPVREPDQFVVEEEAFFPA